jgi:hypothetical protein
MDKLYAVRVLVKPKDTPGVKYKSKSFKGVVISKNASEARVLVFERLFLAFKSAPVEITKEDIHIKSFELFNDFAINSKKDD